LSQTKLYEITIADPDTLEKKNYLYQNYDVMFDKANPVFKVDALKLTEPAKKIPYPILTEQQIKGFDLIICCADNLDVRRLVYRQGFGESCMSKWLDLRAQGRNAALISYLADKKYSDTFLSGPEGSFSCQGEAFNKTNNATDVHFMHAAISGYAAQWIQRWFNNEQVINKFFING